LTIVLFINFPDIEVIEAGLLRQQRKASMIWSRIPRYPQRNVVPINRAYNGPHCFDTQARSLEQAVDIIRSYQKKDKLKKRPYKPTLKQEIGLANGAARLKKISLAGTSYQRNLFKNREKPKPHPLKDLPMEEKKQKLTEMYMTGHWGAGSYAYRKLARAFSLPVGQVAVWLDGMTPPL
jgi:hypothetical protein